MITYLYECPAHGEFEFQHSISAKLETCPHCEKENKHPPSPVKRLISGGSGFILNGDCWAKDSYSK